MVVSTQIAVRLPDELVEYVDARVAAGEASRAAVVAKALRRYRRQLLAEQDAEIYLREGDYPDLGGLAELPVPPLD